MSFGRFPRNSTDAFPKTTDYACAIEKPGHKHKSVDHWVGVICLVIGAATAAILYLY